MRSVPVLPLDVVDAAALQLPDSAPSLAVVARADAAATLLKPVRRRLLDLLSKPGSATTAAGQLGLSRQRVNYHVRALVRAGLLEPTGSRQRRGLTERLFQATASQYVISPAVTRHGRPASAGPEEAVDRFSAAYQVAVAARTIHEVAELASLARQARQRLTTLTLDTEVTLASPAARTAFMEALAEAVTAVVARHHAPDAPDGRRYRLFVGAHPTYRPPDEPVDRRPKKPHARRNP